jgi:4-carboxymuconolactone decarboxylase
MSTHPSSPTVTPWDAIGNGPTLPVRHAAKALATEGGSTVLTGGAGASGMVDSGGDDLPLALADLPRHRGVALRSVPKPVTSPQETRLSPVPFATWDERTREVLLSHLRRPELYLSGKPDAPPMPIVLELFAHHLVLSDRWLSFADMLASSDALLEPMTRELLILRVAWRTRSGYEWSQHRRMGAEAGLDEARLEAVLEGPDAAVWTPEERTLLQAVDEMIDHSAVSPATWEGLTASFDAATIFELLFVIGGYLCLATVLNSIGLQADLPQEPRTEEKEGSRT